MHTTSERRKLRLWSPWILLLALACVSIETKTDPMGPWWDGQGAVIPHDTFPADCKLCHLGSKWQEMVPDFTFDHEEETGVALDGSHAEAKCLRCHNDRGPVSDFARQGCVGCHGDIHESRLGPDCTSCHNEETWNPSGGLELHRRTRFPLVGIHAVTSCRRCHIGAEVGRFTPTDTECVTCHQLDLQTAVNPNHIALGLTERCDRCHMPTRWSDAEL